MSLISWHIFPWPPYLPSLSATARNMHLCNALPPPLYISCEIPFDFALSPLSCKGCLLTSWFYTKFLFKLPEIQISTSRHWLVLFQILTGEDWNVVMYDGIQAYGGVKVSVDVKFWDFFYFSTLSSFCPSGAASKREVAGNCQSQIWGWTSHSSLFSKLS